MHIILVILAVFNTILIPVQFKDSEFSCSAEDLAVLAEGVSAYYSAQMSEGNGFSITVTEPVTLDKERAHYGANAVEGRDRFFYEAVIEACIKANNKIDFSLLDNDSDGSADMVLLIAAGDGENEGAGEDGIWPHSGRLSDDSASLSLNGVKIDTYAVCNEIQHGKFTGIGTLCHETGHCFGIADLYDTDGTGSGGECRAMADTLALMDKGYDISDGHSPCGMCAVEREAAGFAQATEFAPGKWELSPAGEFLKLQGGLPGEYYLIECLEGLGLLITHIDKSDNSAGMSDRDGTVITAAARWETNQVNCNPEFPCASIAAVLNGTKDRFCNFRFRDGTQSSLCIENLSISEDGCARFDVTETFSLDFVEYYQDGAALAFRISGAPGDCQDCRVDWTRNGETLFTTMAERYQDGFRAFLQKGLAPSQQYSFIIRVIWADGSESCFEKSFRTHYYRSGSIPFIYLNNVSRNDDGSIPAGCVFPLKAYNLPDAAAVVWYFNGVLIRNGWFETSSSGELKAEAILEDGSMEILSKTMNVK